MDDRASSDRISPAGQTDVHVEEREEPGKITLTGVLASASEKEAVEQAVRSCAGVSYVENHIQIEPQGVR